MRRYFYQLAKAQLEQQGRQSLMLPSGKVDGENKTMGMPSMAKTETEGLSHKSLSKLRAGA